MYVRLLDQSATSILKSYRSRMLKVRPFVISACLRGEKKEQWVVVFFYI